MAKILYRELSNRYGVSRSSYNGCSTMGCRGEQVANFGFCVAHLSSANADEYAGSLRGGNGALVFSSLEVDADFVQGWVQRIATPGAGGVMTVAVPVVMRGAKMDDGLAFNQVNFSNGIDLSGLSADSVRIGTASISGELVLDSANIADEISLQELRVGALSMVGCTAKIFWLLNSTVLSKLDARSLGVTAGVHIRGTEIHGASEFRDASLGGADTNATISANFGSCVDFTACQFPGETQLGRYSDLPPSRFRGEAKFDEAVFGAPSFGALVMEECSFDGATSFRDARIFGAVSFNDAVFEQVADLSNLQIESAPFRREGFRREGDTSYLPSVELAMCRTRFDSTVNLRAGVNGTAIIEDVTFTGLAEGLSISATRELRISRVSLESYGVLAFSSGDLVAMDQVQMQGGGELRVASARFALTNFACARPVLASSTLQQGQAASTKLATLAGTNCDGLTLSGFDFSEAKFLGASNLDSLIITGELDLHSTSGWHTRRLFLSEEASARALNSASKYWKNVATSLSDEKGALPELRHVTTVYRSLRKGREDQKDEPGSADFYYGEMEMRRLSSAPLSVERAILTLYWIVSGYGLRAWRALILLLLLVVGSAIALSFFPLRPTDECPPSLATALLFSTQSGLSLSGPANLYTPAAQVVQLVLRICMPILIALALLAVRARVKR